MTFRLIRGRYPYDPTGKSPDNLVRGEVHDIPPLTQRIIATRYGAFYKDSLIVTHKGKTLTLNQDYELAGFYQEATAEVGQDVYVLIYFTNEDIIGDVELTYQIVGGDFTGIWETVQSYIDVLLVDPRKPRWDDVINKPQLYAPKEHFHSIDDVYGIDILIPILEEIRYAIGKVNTMALTSVYEKLTRMDRRVDEKLAAYDSQFAEKIAGADFAQQLELLKVGVKEVKDRLTEIENDTTLSEQIKELKKKDVFLQNQLASSVETLQNSINTLIEDKLDKTTFETSYDDLVRRINAKPDQVGLTCEDIGRFPISPWEKGMSILAKKLNGECVRLQPNDNFFQDIGVSISANRTSIAERGTFTVKYIVTNSGVAANDMTELTVVLPLQNQETPYTITNQREVLQNGERFEKVSDTLYRIYGLKRGGTFTLIFDLNTITHGTYQVGGQVTVNNQWDTNRQNNNASLVLTTTTAIPVNNINYVVSESCPLATLTYLPTNTVMRQLQSELKTFTVDRAQIQANVIRPISVQDVLNTVNVIPVTKGDNSFSELRFRLTGVSTVIVKGSDYNWYNTTLMTKNYKIMNPLYIAGSRSFSNNFNEQNGVKLDASAVHLSNISNYTFNPVTGELVIPARTYGTSRDDRNNYPRYEIWCRANGVNCTWQVYEILLQYDAKILETDYTVNGLSNNLYYTELVETKHQLMNRFEGNMVKDGNGELLYYNDHYARVAEVIDTPVYIRKRLAITLPKGTEYNFTIAYRNNNHVLHGNVRGNINVTSSFSGNGENRVTQLNFHVTRNAASTDNLNFGDIIVNIV